MTVSLPGICHQPKLRSIWLKKTTKVTSNAKWTRRKTLITSQIELWQTATTIWRRYLSSNGTKTKLLNLNEKPYDANTIVTLMQELKHKQKSDNRLFLSEQNFCLGGMRAAPLACSSKWIIVLGHPLVYWQATNNSLSMKWKWTKKN